MGAIRLLAERLRSSVPHRIRQRGNEYWHYGAVELIEIGPDAMEASVYGTEEYAVGLYWLPDEGLLEGNCTCPYFYDRLDICKHIWATVLAADAKGHLSAAREAPSVRLEPDWAEPPVVSQELVELEPADGFAKPAASAWSTRLAEVVRAAPSLDASQRVWLGERRILYLLDLDASRRNHAVTIELQCRDRKKNGDWGALKSAVPDRKTISRLPDRADRRLLAMVSGAREAPGSGWYGVYDRLPKRFIPPDGILAEWVRLAAETGRLMMPAAAGGDATPLEWDAGAPWRLELEVSEASDGDELQLSGYLARDDARLPLSEPLLLSSAGLVFFRDRVARLEDGGAFGWVPVLRRDGAVRIPASQRHQLVETLLSLPQPPALHLPEDLRYEEVQGEPLPRLTVRRTTNYWLTRSRLLEVVLEFDYEGESVAWGDDRLGVYRPEHARLLRRDREAEERALGRMRELGVREAAAYSSAESEPYLVVPERRLAELVHALTAEGWRVEAEGRIYRRAGDLNLEVTSGIDWFDLQGTAEFGEQAVELPRLLKALERGERSVLLDDGSLGVLPEEWLEKYGSLAKMGVLDEDRLRFRRSQIGLLDALLAARPEIEFDQAMARARRQLSKFSGVKPREAPRTFKGELRDYQKEGLGWLHFLRAFGFGGCLADDMGLGKTVQVLALLESRRQARRKKSTPEEKRPGPSLVVMPRSLVFNWRNEAARFTPQIRVLEYTGPQRKAKRDRLGDYDVVLTTYGTLRRDIAFLKDFEFDYAILDEAQAIKNHKSATAKASRLLQARHYLALTGTPIENHAGDLMSILDFLNPGLFGPGRTLHVPKAVREGTLDEGGSPNPQLALIAGAVRPFILRRTKGQVAKDLPKKVKQTLYCELPPRQRKDYDQLRAHYRNVLLGQVDERGLARSKMHVLAALLRLRQAACHPGLIDPGRREEESGKLAILLPHLEEVLDGGHKALVFSQFTSMLSIVRSHLDARGIRYEYLDGKTRKRELRIRRFQEDPDCPLFLISLKAGGLGLNLTAAEYVFLLDPWWNPAVEAQAIDRTHRIGQTRPVFAYSLIARDTVEEKVLELQQSKRRLAEAIIRADSSLIGNLTREDLVELLS